MTSYKFDWSEDIKLKLRFLEILFLIVTVLVSLNPVLGDFGGIILLSFLVFAPIHYFFLSNGEMNRKALLLSSALPAFSFSTLFSIIFLNQGALHLFTALIYIPVVGIAIWACLLPRKYAVNVVENYTPTSAAEYMEKRLR